MTTKDSKKTKIALIGECMIELNGAPFGDMQQTFGGDSLNSAVYLARAVKKKADIHYVTALGHDPLSQGMIERWQQEGINTDLVMRDPNRQPGLYLIQLDPQGERTFMYWRDQSAAKYMLQHDRFQEIAETLSTMDMVYLSGITLAILPEQDKQKLLNLLSLLKLKGVKIIFDSNYRPKLWDSIESTQAIYQQVLSITDLALVTDEDEAMLWLDNSVEDTLTRLKSIGVKQAVVKMGPKGCIYQNFENTDENAELINTIPVENVIDTTSAGDAFNAGYLTGFVDNKSAKECALMGHALAGVVIQYKGAIISSEFTEEVIRNF